LINRNTDCCASERVSTCAGVAKWRHIEALTSTQLLVVNKKAVIYDEAINCCKENFAQLVKIDTRSKADRITNYLKGLMRYTYLFSSTFIHVHVKHGMLLSWKRLDNYLVRGHGFVWCWHM